mmetsp:Transcript_4930/g.12309  ORF Transcript_4930/g.12309 Transcript_4930/m.12309 type:complete len:209 (+) Transcript_4930:1609-2235(+)
MVTLCRPFTCARLLFDTKVDDPIGSFKASGVSPKDDAPLPISQKTFHSFGLCKSRIGFHSGARSTSKVANDMEGTRRSGFMFSLNSLSSCFSRSVMKGYLATATRIRPSRKWRNSIVASKVCESVIWKLSPSTLQKPNSLSTTSPRLSSTLKSVGQVSLCHLGPPTSHLVNRASEHTGVSSRKSRAKHQNCRSVSTYGSSSSDLSILR